MEIILVFIMVAGIIYTIALNIVAAAWYVFGR